MLSQLSNLTIDGIPKQLAFPSLPSVETFVARGGNTERDSIDGGASFLRGIAASMHNLKKLEINYFNELPNELNSLSSLQELHISFCHNLESIPECVLQGLSSLQVLKFQFCSSLKSLPEGMTNLTCLERLEIICCPNLILPATTNKLTSLRQLRIYGGYQNETLLNGLEGIPSLQYLYLGGFRSLVTLPDWLGTMTSLQSLTISSCPKLSSLPDWLGTMTSLQTLDISSCPKLSSLPDWLGTMTSLQTLEISWCPKLSSLPASFKELINLKELTIYGCPMLVERCKKERGEEWHKIAHVPKLDIKSTFEPEPSFNEKMKELWNQSKQFWRSHHDDYEYFDNLDRIVDYSPF
ncbi:hypothetical protein P8452_55287 [Trifolium repens]|nr:hypothetical protein P8452_55287 [Trifolium repens]